MSQTGHNEFSVLDRETAFYVGRLCCQRTLLFADDALGPLILGASIPVDVQMGEDGHHPRHVEGHRYRLQERVAHDEALQTLSLAALGFRRQELVGPLKVSPLLRYANRKSRPSPFAADEFVIPHETSESGRFDDAIEVLSGCVIQHPKSLRSRIENERDFVPVRDRPLS